MKSLLMFLPLLVFFINSPSSIADDRRLAWVGLYNPEMLAWVENENCLKNPDCKKHLCPESLSAEEKKQCEAEHLKPKSWELSVFDAPTKDGKKTGIIILSATPGEGLHAIFKSEHSSVSIPFEPDLTGGYRPYFHQTALDWNKDGWFLLPKNPLPSPGWIHLKEITGETDDHLIPVKAGEIYKLDDKSIMVMDISETGLLIRPEQPADMWCEEGNPPPLKPARPVKLGHDALFDKDGHLKLKIKYTKGC